MKIETVVSVRSLWFVDVRQLNPRGRNLYRVIVPLLEGWFGFAAPQEFDEEKGVRFRGGEFSPSGRGDDLTGIEVTLYSDGLLAIGTTTTEDTDSFLEQALTRSAQEGIITYRPEMIRRKWYASEFVARSERELAIPAFHKVCDLLSRSVYSGAQQVAPIGVSLDVEAVVQGKQIPYRFERKAGTRFSENLYYSHGPLSTGQHLAVLQAIEEALAL